MPEHTLRVNNTTVRIERHPDAAISAGELLDRADFDPARYQLHADAGGDAEFSERTGDHLITVDPREHEQVIARLRYAND